jgi:hypothetical protein
MGEVRCCYRGLNVGASLRNAVWLGVTVCPNPNASGITIPSYFLAHVRKWLCRPAALVTLIKCERFGRQQRSQLVLATHDHRQLRAFGNHAGKFVDRMLGFENARARNELSYTCKKLPIAITGDRRITGGAAVMSRQAERRQQQCLGKISASTICGHVPRCRRRDNSDDCSNFQAARMIRPDSTPRSPATKCADAAVILGRLRPERVVLCNMLA